MAFFSKYIICLLERIQTEGDKRPFGDCLCWELCVEVAFAHIPPHSFNVFFGECAHSRSML